MISKFSDKQNILQLVSILIAQGVREAVVCPGSRNAPLVQSMIGSQKIKCHSVSDERSAGFYAIGLALATKRVLAVCCTSGSALLNLHSAVSEAFYQKIALLIISADRPAVCINQMEGQTLPQYGVFGSLVKLSVSLPQVNTEEDAYFCNRLINEAVLECTHRSLGPVHINIPIAEPLFEFNLSSLPDERIIKRCIALPLEEIKKYNKILLVVGQLATVVTQANLEDLELISSTFVLCCEHLSNCNAGIKAVDSLLARLTAQEKGREEVEQLYPDLLITMGGHIVSKRMRQFMKECKVKEHWHIDEEGKIVDLSHSVTKIIEADVNSSLKALSHFITNTDRSVFSSYLSLWKEKLSYYLSFDKANNRPTGAHSTGNLITEAPSNGNLPYGAVKAVKMLLEQLPDDSTLHLANSSVLRYVELFELKSSIKVQCNRGVNGIDGSLSTAIAYSQAERAKGRLNFVLIGDMSFFYDMNVLCHGADNPYLRIMMLNNGGGSIFYTLKTLDSTLDSMPYISGHHTCSAKSWVESLGFIYMRVSNDKELEEAIKLLLAGEQGGKGDLPRFGGENKRTLNKSEVDDFERAFGKNGGKKPIFVEIMSDRQQDAKDYIFYLHGGR